MDYTEKKLRRLNTYEGIIINVGLDRVSLPDGSEAFREIVEHPGGACILPVDGEGNAYCVRQYRYPIGEHLLEAPAGKLERGEDPLVCAVRELGEETGFTAGRIVPLGAMYPSCMSLVDSAIRTVKRGEISDGKTAIAALQAEHILAGE